MGPPGPAGARRLRGRAARPGVEVHLFGDLLCEALEIPEARHLVLDRVFDEKEYGPLATGHLGAAFDGLTSAALAEALVGG